MELTLRVSEKGDFNIPEDSLYSSRISTPCNFNKEKCLKVGKVISFSESRKIHKRKRIELETSLKDYGHHLGLLI